MLVSAHSPVSPLPSERTLSEVRLGTSAFLSRKDTLFCPLGLISVLETVARRRSAALLSEFGLGHVREYAPFALILSALHLILRAKSQHI